MLLCALILVALVFAFWTIRTVLDLRTVLMEVDLARHEDVPEKIYNIEHVLRVDVILGPFDLVVLADVGLDGLHDLLAEIVKVKGVMRSMTMYEIKRKKGHEEQEQAL